MKLSDLNATFLGDVQTDGSCKQQDGIDGAQGVMFQCPKCAAGKQVEEIDGRRCVPGVHHIICWFRNPRNAQPVPDWLDPKPGRWYFKGNSLEDLTFTGPGMCSVLLTSGCGWHGHVRRGEAV